MQTHHGTASWKQLAEQQVRNADFILLPQTAPAEAAPLLQQLAGGSSTASTTTTMAAAAAAKKNFRAQYQRLLDEAALNAADAAMQLTRFGFAHASLPLWDALPMFDNNDDDEDDDERKKVKKQRRRECASTPTGGASKRDRYVLEAIDSGAHVASRCRSRYIRATSGSKHAKTPTTASRFIPPTELHLPTKAEAVELLEILYESSASSAAEHNNDDDDDEADVEAATQIVDFVRRRPTRLEVLVGILVHECGVVMKQTIARKQRGAAVAAAGDDRPAGRRSSSNMHNTSSNDKSSIMEDTLIAVSASVRHRCFLAISSILTELGGGGGGGTAGAEDYTSWSFHAPVAAALALLIPTCLPLQPLSSLDAIRGVIGLITPGVLVDGMQEQEEVPSSAAKRGAAGSLEVWNAVRTAAGLPAL